MNSGREAGKKKKLPIPTSKLQRNSKIQTSNTTGAAGLRQANRMISWLCADARSSEYAARQDHFQFSDGL